MLRVLRRARGHGVESGTESLYGSAWFGSVWGGILGGGIARMGDFVTEREHFPGSPDLL